MEIVSLLFGGVIGSTSTILALYAKVWRQDRANEDDKYRDDHRFAVIARWLRENDLEHVAHEWLNVHGDLPNKSELDEGKLLNHEIEHGTRCSECSEPYQWTGDEFECRNPDCPSNDLEASAPSTGADARRGEQAPPEGRQEPVEEQAPEQRQGQPPVDQPQGQPQARQDPQQQEPSSRAPR